MNKHGDSGLVLYTHEVSPWGDRAVAMLREANLKFDYVVLNPFEPPEYFKEVSPLGKIPALSVDGKSVLESWVILEYINDRFLESKFLPKEPIKRAKVRFASKHFSETINSIIRECATSFHNKEAQSTYKQQVSKFLHKFNQVLLEQAPTGPYFLGQQFSLADVAIAPFFLRLEAFNKLCFDNFGHAILTECPRLFEFYQGITSRPSSQKTFMGEKAFIDFQNSFFHFFP